MYVVLFVTNFLDSSIRQNKRNITK